MRGFLSHQVGDMALAAPGAVFRRQKAGHDIGWQFAVRVERLEGGKDLAGGVVDARLDVDVKGFIVVGHRHRGLEMAAARRRHTDDGVAEGYLAQLEGGPVEVGIELVGNGHPLCRCCGSGVVLKVDAVGQGGVVTDIVVSAIAAGASQGVGVFGSGTTSTASA